MDNAYGRNEESPQKQSKASHQMSIHLTTIQQMGLLFVSVRNNQRVCLGIKIKHSLPIFIAKICNALILS
jgi:hypothetical protein